MNGTISLSRMKIIEDIEKTLKILKK